MGKIELKNYTFIPSHAVLATKWLTDLYEKLGRPKTPFSKSGAKLMEVIIATWQDLYPDEYKLWIEERKTYKETEKDISLQVKYHTGRSLASYPMYIYRVMKVFFPDFDPTNRKNCLKMVKKWPIFQFANKR